MKNFILFLLIILTASSCIVDDPEKDKSDILSVLDMQQKAWNDHDLEGFMEGYWKSDSLKYYGSRGLTSGWEKTLSNYKKGYPTKEYTGTLKFVIDAINQIDSNSYYVMGQYHLTRSVGDANGVFMIVFKRINGEWRIISDLSC